MLNEMTKKGRQMSWWSAVERMGLVLGIVIHRLNAMVYNSIVTFD